MKRIIVLLIAVVLCVSLVGCGSPAQETKDETLGLNSTATFSSLKITATEIKESEGSTYFAPEEGNIFVGIKFTVENTSDEEQSVSSLMMFEGYANDVKCDYSISAAMAFDEGTIDGSVAPGKKLIGWYAMEVPKDWSTIELQVQPELLSNDSAKFVFTK